MDTGHTDALADKQTDGQVELLDLRYHGCDFGFCASEEEDG